jgi:hypothetical protein
MTAAPGDAWSHLRQRCSSKAIFKRISGPGNQSPAPNKTSDVPVRDRGDRSTLKCMGIMFRPLGRADPPSHSPVALLAETSL